MNRKSVNMKNVKEYMYSLNSYIIFFEKYVRAKKIKVAIVLDRAQRNPHNSSLNIFC